MNRGEGDDSYKVKAKDMSKHDNRYVEKLGKWKASRFSGNKNKDED